MIKFRVKLKEKWNYEKECFSTWNKIHVYKLLPLKITILAQISWDGFMLLKLNNRTSDMWIDHKLLSDETQLSKTSDYWKLGDITIHKSNQLRWPEWWEMVVLFRNWMCFKYTLILYIYIHLYMFGMRGTHLDKDGKDIGHAF
jgi:hypothetical protein